MVDQIRVFSDEDWKFINHHPVSSPDERAAYLNAIATLRQKYASNQEALLTLDIFDPASDLATISQEVVAILNTTGDLSKVNQLRQKGLAIIHGRYPALTPKQIKKILGGE